MHVFTQIKKEYDVQDELDDETDLRDLLDSLDIMNYIFYVEDKYNITVSEEIVEENNFLIIGEAANYVLKRRSV